MSILDSAELLLQAKNYSGSGNWLDEANSHDGVNNGSLFKAFTTAVGQYVFLPNATANRVDDTTPPAAADIAEGDTATFAAWYRPTTSKTFANLWGTISGSGDGIMLRAARSVALRPNCFVDNGPTQVQIEADSAVTINVWHHLVVTIDHTANELMSLYVDGVVTTTSPVDITAASGTYAAGVLTISADNLAGDVAYVEFYKDLATAGEISTAHAGGVGTGIVGLTGAVSVVDFSDTTMVASPYASFTDPQSNGYIIRRGSSGLRTTIIDRAWALLTTDDYIEIADDAGLDFSGSEDLTMMVMFRTNTVASGSDVLLAKKDNLTTAAGYALVRNTATGQGIIADGTADDDDTVATVAVHILHTLTMVRNTTDDDVEVFLDGVSSGSPTTDSTTSTLANALPLRIGATSGTAANFFEGQIGAVAGWRSALTAAEVLAARTALTVGAGGGGMLLLDVG